MNYAINNKEYTEFDINKRCAELMGFNLFEGCTTKTKGDVWVRLVPKYNYDPCNNPQDTWPIIEKIWGWLQFTDGASTAWRNAVVKHKCTKLVAACILFIEMNED